MTWAPDYLSLTDGKEYLRVVDDADDAWIAELITAASRAIDQRCRRQFGTAAGTRTYSRWQAVPAIRGEPAWLLPVDDLGATPPPTVAIGTVTLVSSAYVLAPRNAAADALPYTGLIFPSQPVGDVTVISDVWGWAAPPQQVRVACRLQLGRWYVRRESPFGVAGSPSDGSETRLLARLDPDVATSLAGLSRTQAPG